MKWWRKLSLGGSAQQKSPALSCLSLGLLWLGANVASEWLEEFSLWLEPVFAVAQWLVMRRYIRHIGWWLPVSFWGWFIAFILIQLLFGVGNWIFAMVPGGELEVGGVPVNMQVFWVSVLVKLLEWAVIGVGQWLVLRRHFQPASWWVLASAAGGAVKGGVELIIGTVVGGVTGALVGSLGYGAVTGVALVWLLKPRIHHRQLRRRRLSLTL